ncbi:MAG: hypothetical protein HN842_12555 [Gammaproteobacteria bacterium]|nr:hypothetical protein [Gammaproteobacteria bacterium]
MESLQTIFTALSEEDRYALLRYGSYLLNSAREGDAAVVAINKVEPQPISRPEEERVVAAIRRLAETYPMLNHDHLFRQSADLMSAHLVSGRAAVEVIDELEEIFLHHYHRYLGE